MNTSQRQVSGKRILVQLGVIAWLVLAVLLLSMPLTTATESKAAKRPADPVSGLDPKVGTKLTWADSDSFPIKNQTNPPLVLVALGNCDSCSLNSFDSQSLPKRKNVAFGRVLYHDLDAVAFIALPSAAHPVLFELRIPIREYLKLNAAWTPKFYAIDRAGAIFAISRFRETPTEFLSRIGIP